MNTTANEELMQEHGVLSRILLIYERLLDIMEVREVPVLDVLSRATGVIRVFIQDHHERIEERFVFRMLRDKNRLPALVDILFNQHRAGRMLVEDITALTASAAISASREMLKERMRQFISMYRPHKAREDTELFPVFKAALAPEAYAGFGDEFEKLERRRLGMNGFEKMTAEVAGLEAIMGINQLSAFTPDIPFRQVVYR